ncbi:hypothetical protein Egran_02415 [Elaphomyces granulatus]|uniref:Transcription factor domain-containing protein n=1 Tax=Elaphomyces granulatus TaxID=519963 RepID=A0A232M097_9EURO|nr:hypothetical protein Egran_02415 [Elaphomyces granulatus]
MRMALDLRLQEAYDELIQRLSTRDAESVSRDAAEFDDTELSLMWNFCVDAGKPSAVRETGDTRRCRILLNHPSVTALDLRLLSQVEIIAKTNDSLSRMSNSDQLDIADFVRESKMDIDIWFEFVKPLSIKNSNVAGEEEPSLLINLRVQTCWAEMMVYCKALRYIGVENVAAMSTTERDFLIMAKISARKHLKLITGDPVNYLSKLRYAMDFVWAKCAFCFLLLLKLSRLLPEASGENWQLLQDGNLLVQELSKVDTTSGDGNGGNIYLQILKLSVEKYEKSMMESETAEDTDMASTSQETPGPFWDLFDAQSDLQSFVPRQFVFEWDFPGLNLFYFPTAWQDLFGDISFNPVS